MKYICTESEHGLQEVFTFPKTVDHDVMAEALERMKNKTTGTWERIWRRPVSAGFVENGECFGNSITLDLASRDEDTEILRKQTL